MTALNIRAIDPALKQALKVEAAKRGLTLREYVVKTLQTAIDNDRYLERLKQGASV